MANPDPAIAMPYSAQPKDDSMPAVLDELWEVDYVDEGCVESAGERSACSFASHIKAFAHALAESDLIPDGGDQSPMSPKSPQMGENSISIDNQGNEHHLGPDSRSAPDWNHGPQRQERVEKVKALSDFAPIHQRVSTRCVFRPHSGV